MDPLSQLVDGPRGSGVFTLRCVMAPPWSIAVRDGAPLTLVAASSGRLVLVVDGAEHLLRAGDVALVRGPDPYTVASAGGLEPLALIEPGQRCRAMDGSDLFLALRHGVRTWGNAPDGRDSFLVASYDRELEVGAFAAGALPRLVHLPAGTLDSGLVDLLAREIGTELPGQSALLDRLVDALLLSAIRCWVTAKSENAPPGWLAGTRDPAVSRALQAIHEQPGRPWTVESIALAANMSRAALARRFRATVGEPPLAYLTRWRMALAAEMLGDPSRTLASIARDIGYGSAFAFSTAFKRHRGLSPARYRVHLQRHPGPDCPAASERPGPGLPVPAAPSQPLAASPRVTSLDGSGPPPRTRYDAGETRSHGQRSRTP